MILHDVPAYFSAVAAYNASQCLPLNRSSLFYETRMNKGSNEHIYKVLTTGSAMKSDGIGSDVTHSHTER